VVIGE
jgi:hypothetical protein